MRATRSTARIGSGLTGTPVDPVLATAALAKETPAAAEQRLAKTAYGIKGAKYNLQNLSTVLLYLASEKSMPTVSACIRDVAILLAHFDTTTTTTTITDTIRNIIQPNIDLLGDATRRCEEATARSLEAAASVPTAPTIIATPTSAWAAGPPHPKLREDMARFRLQRRQFFVDSEDKDIASSTLDLDDKALLERGRLALETMHILDKKPANIKIVAARRLDNKGVCYELESEQSGEWLRRPTATAAFLHAYGTGVKLRMKSYQLIAHFIPVAFTPHEPATLDHITIDNSLPAKALTHSRWVKRPHLRRQGQKVAHAILTFDNPAAANTAIDNGLLIENCRITCHKLMREPRLCLKCQLIDLHLITDCPDDHFTCGTCGQHHPTSECTVKTPELRHCANCARHPSPNIQAKAHGHGTWARSDCPSFVAANAKYSKRYPECRYSHFPTEDPTTWHLTDDTANAPTPAEAATLPLADRLSDPTPRAPAGERFKTTTQSVNKNNQQPAKAATTKTANQVWRRKPRPYPSDTNTPTPIPTASQFLDATLQDRPSTSMGHRRPTGKDTTLDTLWANGTTNGRRPRATSIATTSVMGSPAPADISSRPPSPQPTSPSSWAPSPSPAREHAETTRLKAWTPGMENEDSYYIDNTPGSALADS
jgi:hypothetical protein